MPKRIIVVCSSLILLIGCATTPPPKLDLLPTSKIGIINLVEKDITHTFVGTTVFNNFTKNYTVDWDIPLRIEEELIKSIKKTSNYEIVKIEPTSVLIDNKLRLIDTTWKIKLKSDFISEFEELARANNVDIIYLINHYHGDDYIGMSSVVVKGYGLYTRSLFGMKESYAYAYLEIDGIKGNPPEYIGGARFWEHPKIKDFKYPSDVKNMPMEELNKIEPLLVDHIPDFVHNALIRTGFTTDYESN